MSAEARRAELLDRLEAQRRDIQSALPAALAPPHLSAEFPRSQTVRLVMTEPALLAMLSSLVVPLLGKRLPRLLRVLPVVFAAIRIGRLAGAPDAGKRPGS
jgi:hypothetical protein